MSPQLGIQSSYQENPAAKVATVTIRGELDLYSLDEFKTVLATAEQSECPVILLDLRELTFVDSSGLGAIIGVQGRAAKNGRKVVICPSEVVSKTFEVTGLHRVLKTIDSPDELEA